MRIINYDFSIYARTGKSSLAKAGCPYDVRVNREATKAVEYNMIIQKM